MVRFADDGGERRPAETGRGLAPVIPLFAGARPASEPPAPGLGAPIGEADAWHPTWASDGRDPAAHDVPGAGDSRVEGETSVGLAEKALLKRLRTRSLSAAEARDLLEAHGLDAAQSEHVVSTLHGYGYLDDASLAEQLVHVGTDRKGQGRQAIAQTLARRGIPRDIADAALAALPEDDFERALEFARRRARSLKDVDRDAAVRRLAGQLARRGFGGSLALTAARTALDERVGGETGVRFR